MVEKHGKGWRYDFTKKQRRYRNGGYLTREEAKEAEAKARTQARRINTNFIKLCNSRLRDVELRRSKGHFERNELLIRRLIALWGTKWEINREDVKEYIESVAQVSPEKANRALTLIRALFSHGIREGLTDYNPVKGFEKYGVDKQSKYIPPKEDIDKVLSVANEEQRRYLLTIIHTIARVREVNRLKWDDVNLEKRFLILRTRKSKNSDLVERKISINDTLYQELDSAPKNGEYVFMNKRTKKDFDYRDKLLKLLCKKAEVREFTYHCLRHYGASKLADLNVPLTDIQVILGHQRATTTDIYLQSLKGSSVEAMKRLED